VKANPGQWNGISRAFGYANPAQFIKAVWGGSQALLWNWDDFFKLFKINEDLDKGYSLEQAIKRTEYFHPNYRVPSTVMGSRALAQLASNPYTERFGRWDYGRLAYFGNIAQAIAGKLPDVSRAEGLDKLAMLGFMAYVAYPWLQEEADKAARALGYARAYIPHFGVSAVANIAGNVARGVPGVPSAVLPGGRRASAESELPMAYQDTQSPQAAMLSLFAPGFLAVPFELATGETTYGQPIVRWDDVKNAHSQALYDAMDYLAGKFPPAQAAATVIEGKRDLLSSVLNILVGARLATQAPEDRKVRARLYEERSAERRDQSLANQRGAAFQ
jgi:hypothetical protein